MRKVSADPHSPRGNVLEDPPCCKYCLPRAAEEPGEFVQYYPCPRQPLECKLQHRGDGISFYFTIALHWVTNDKISSGGRNVFIEYCTAK